MLRVYRGFVEVARRARGVRDALPRPRRRPSGAALFHCTAGKDRTGWAAALLLHLAGVDDATILEDYLLTNSFSSATREKYLGMVREHLGADKVAVYERVMVADEAYLQAGYDAVAATYGDRLGYLRDGLGLDDRLLSTGSGHRMRHVTDERPPFAWREVGVVVAVQAAVLLVMAPFYGPGRDELYFVSAGQRLAWGYPDQPSFTPFLARLATEIAPHHLVVLRLPALLGVVGIVLLAVQFARLLGAGRGGQVLTAVVVAASAVIMAMGHRLTTATFDTLAWTAVLVLATQAVRRPSGRGCGCSPAWSPGSGSTTSTPSCSCCSGSWSRARSTGSCGPSCGPRGRGWPASIAARHVGPQPALAGPPRLAGLRPVRRHRRRVRRPRSAGSSWSARRRSCSAR